MKTFNSPSAGQTMAEVPAGEDDRIDVGRIFGTLWRGRWILLVAAILGGMIGFYQAFFVEVPRYQATANVVLETQSEQIVNIDSVVSGMSTDFYSMNTQLEVIRSRELIRKLVEELDLVSDPEFNYALRPPPAFSLRRAVTDFVQTLRGNDTAQAPAPEPTPADVEERQEARLQSVISSVRGAISAGTMRNTYILTISATTTDRQKSQLLANTLAQLYIQDQIEVKYQATENATAWLSARVVELEAELAERQDQIKQMRSEMSLVSEEGIELLNQRVRDLRDRVARNRADLEASEARLERLRRIREGGDAQEIADTFDDPILTRMLTQAEGSLSGAARETFLTRADTRLEALENDIARSRAQLQSLETSLAATEQEVSAEFDKLQRLRQAEREIESTRTLYETFLTRLKETSVQRGLQQADSRLLSPATRGAYISPQKGRIVGLAAMLGVLAAAAYLFLRQFANKRLRDANELEMLTGRPVLGEIPLMPSKRRANLLKFLAENPTSVAAEAYRNLRTSLLLSNIDNQPKLIMVTSSIPGESKTTSCISLAHNLAGLGKRVLLVECDIRRQTLGEYFRDTERKEGLLTAMTSDRPVEDFILRREGFGADILLGERSKMSAADVFSSEAFRGLMDRLRERYDFVLIDTPPVLIAPDARIVGQQMDAVLYAVAWDKTARGQVQEGLRQLDLVNVRVSGLVMTMVDPKGQKKYGYSAYGYHQYGKSGYYDT